jgi:hypothetical protein
MAQARIDDPQTSHEAASSVRNVSETQLVILGILRNAMHDEKLVAEYESLVRIGSAPMASQSGIRSRRATLVDMGLIEDTGSRVKTASGRNAIVWQSVR